MSEKMKKIVLVLSLIFSLLMGNVIAIADESQYSIAFDSSVKVINEPIVEENGESPKEEEELQLHFVMIAFLFLFGGALGMVLIGGQQERAEGKENSK